MTNAVGLDSIALHVGEQLTTKLGIEILEAAPTRVVATMPVKGNRQHVGAMHGGAYCALGETVASLAAILHAGPESTAYGIELSASHHRRAVEGLVTAVATAVTLGRTLCTHDVAITDERGMKVSSLRVTNIVRARPTPPRSAVV